ncbi:MAG TPA: sigma-70 family RNA polymerase sigma factor [Terriglobales bacterium]|jgi:RNA polymerase sigma-70 factor (ECF subfamily)
MEHAATWMGTIEAAEGQIAELADFDALVRQYRPRIFRFLLGSLRDRDSAESICQEVFLKAYKARSGFRGEASVQTWLMQIAVNRMRDYLRNRRLQFWRQLMVQSTAAEEIADSLPDGGMSPEKQVIARQQASAVWRAAQDLSNNQRTVFLLRFVEDMDIEEIVVATGMKPTTVKTHLSRALQNVRNRLGNTR